MVTHQLLIRLALGEAHEGVYRRGSPHLVPLMFYMISRDHDPASKATALRAVVNESHDNERNLEIILE